MSETPYYSFGLPIDISTHGHEIDQLFYLMHWFMLILFVGWGAFFVYTIFRFRARKGHKATYKPKYTKFSTYLEVGIALFEAFVLVVLAIPAWKLAKTALPTAENRFSVRVVGEQFAWNIHYPGADGVFGRTDINLIDEGNAIGLDFEDEAAKDDLVTINQLHVPINKPILVYLSSKDVIHSFALPTVRVKQDAVPGFTFPVWFEAKQAGKFEIVCAQLCGLGHYRMRGDFVTSTAKDFQAWFDEQREYMEEDMEL